MLGGSLLKHVINSQNMAQFMRFTPIKHTINTMKEPQIYLINMLHKCSATEFQGSKGIIMLFFLKKNLGACFSSSPRMSSN